MIGRLIALAVCIAAVVGLFFLYQEEPPGEVDEVRIYEPGTYKGAPDSPLDPAQEEELRSRVRNQNAI